MSNALLILSLPGWRQSHWEPPYRASLSRASCAPVLLWLRTPQTRNGALGWESSSHAVCDVAVGGVGCSGDWKSLQIWKKLQGFMNVKQSRSAVTVPLSSPTAPLPGFPCTATRGCSALFCDTHIHTQARFVQVVFPEFTECCCCCL